MSGQGLKGKLKPLSKKYIEQRLRKQLSPNTSPTKSNLTLTGSMLEAIRSFVRPNKIEFTIQGDKNKKKAEYNSTTRPFLGLTQKERRKIKKDLEARLARAFRRG